MQVCDEGMQVFDPVIYAVVVASPAAPASDHVAETPDDVAPPHETS